MRNPLRATYRIQVRPEFTLKDSAETVPYLDELGVSHVYTSPFLQASPGSTHGYDVVNYRQINQEMGGQKGLDRLLTALGQEDRMGLIMDLVPNHMAIHLSNTWLWDVLKNGPSSRYSPYFDIDFTPGGSYFNNAILIPVLDDQFGRVLERGDIQLVYDGQEFTVRYYENVYPVDPGSLGSLLARAAERVRSSQNSAGGEELAFLAEAFERLPGAQTTSMFDAHVRYRDTEVLRKLLASLTREQPGVRQAIQDITSATNQDSDALDAFLSRQNYRLALWKISATELGYRRFFNINSMIGLRMENPAVYRDVHALALELVRNGKVDGLRIDHPDGLRNPRQYLERLRTDAPDAWLGVEKILELGEGESLPITWPVQGTTGYDFLNRVNGLFVDPDGEVPLTDFYINFTGKTGDYAALVHDSKLFAAQELLGPDLNRLTELFLQVCERHRLYRDTTRDELRIALAETAACLPVYRTYIETGAHSPEEGQPSERDIAYIDQASEAAKKNVPELDPRLFDFLGSLLKRKVAGALEEDLLARFQQYTGPVMAKGVEDQAFYIFNRFVSLNEVGGDPGRFGISVDEFHRSCQETQTNWPETLLATSSHDTKRSEDVRARLNVISEMHGEWVEAVRRWAGMTNEHRKEEYPDRNAEYLLYQILVGAWPISADRVVQYMRKAGREAGEFTSWVAPNEEYEGAVESFARAILDDSSFTADLETFVAEVLEAGRINSLSQTMLKLTAPGIPDIYQGTEIWDLSLVDPDNRRLADNGPRRQLLRSLSDDSPPETILAGMDKGLPKLWVIRQALRLRKQHPDWFSAGSDYTPLWINHRVDKGEPDRLQEEAARDAVNETGVAEHEDLFVAVTGAPRRSTEEPAISYLRGADVLVAVPRLVTRFRADWDRYSLVVPPGKWRNWLTHELVSGGTISLGALFEQFPVALLSKEEPYG